MMRLGSLTLLVTLLLAGCGGADAPKGRWEGFSQSANWLIAVRLQVDAGNIMHATALSVSVADTSLLERLALAKKIRHQLDEQWPVAPEGKIDFKNNTITKARGVAPLFTFDPRTRAMTFHFYAGGRLTERIKLFPVREYALR